MPTTVRDLTEALDRYAAGRIGPSSLFRALAQHRGWTVAAEHGEARPVPTSMDVEGRPALWVFTDRDAAERAPTSPPTLIHGADGGYLFGGLPEHFAYVEVNPGSASALRLNGAEVPGLRRMGRAVQVERALADPDDPGFARLLRGFDAYRLPLVGAGEKWRPVTLPGDRGERCCVVFTAEDALDAFLSAPDGTPAIDEHDGEQALMVAVLDGRHLFSQLPAFGHAGVLFNPKGPPPRAAYASGLCQAVLTAR